ncbi:MAG: (Fe-S)-binding protein [Deltaproteobacteria bacterium]|nr:(Fe-S)-binding protein [Deltaproteobacteria bacterium]
MNTYTVFDLLLKYIKEKRVKLDKSKNRIPSVYHDPCNYGRKSEKLFGYGYYKEPRIILDHCCENWIDTYPSENHQFCCGGGGGTLVTGYNEERIYYGRKKIDQIKASGAQMVIVPCHSCHGQINSLKKEYAMENLQVKYLWEVFADALVLD